MLKKEIEKLVYSLGADLFGVADVRNIKKDFHFLDEILKDLDYAICIGMRLSCAILDEIKDAPTKIYYHHYRQANMALDQIAFKISNFIQSKGYKALPVPASQIVDWEKQTAHLSHKKIGAQYSYHPDQGRDKARGERIYAEYLERSHKQPVK